MKTLIVEDDFTSRLLLQEFLKSYGPFHIAVNGKEAVEANVIKAREQQCDYFLVKPIQKAKLIEQLRKLALIA
jgi:response regulator of citrate/malate metabolism